MYFILITKFIECLKAHHSMVYIFKHFCTTCVRICTFTLDTQEFKFRIKSYPWFYFTHYLTQINLRFTWSVNRNASQKNLLFMMHCILCLDAFFRNASTQWHFPNPTIMSINVKIYNLFQHISFYFEQQDIYISGVWVWIKFTTLESKKTTFRSDSQHFLSNCMLFIYIDHIKSY